MAKIKGIELKGIQMFTARNGYGLSANIYIDNKKVGTAHDAGNGGVMDISFEKHQNKAIFDERVEAYYLQNPSTMDGEEGFINELVALKEVSSIFKKNVKKGYPITVVVSANKRQGDLNDLNVEEDRVLGVTNEQAIQIALDQYKPVEHTVYRSLEDFNIQ